MASLPYRPPDSEVPGTPSPSLSPNAARWTKRARSAESSDDDKLLVLSRPVSRTNAHGEAGTIGRSDVVENGPGDSETAAREEKKSRTHGARKGTGSKPPSRPSTLPSSSRPTSAASSYSHAVAGPSRLTVNGAGSVFQLASPSSLSKTPSLNNNPPPNQSSSSSTFHRSLLPPRLNSSTRPRSASPHPRSRESSDEPLASQAPSRHPLTRLSSTNSHRPASPPASLRLPLPSVSQSSASSTTSSSRTFRPASNPGLSQHFESDRCNGGYRLSTLHTASPPPVRTFKAVDYAPYTKSKPNSRPYLLIQSDIVGRRKGLEMKRKELERRECELRDIERKFWDDVPDLAMELGISAGRGDDDSEESKITRLSQTLLEKEAKIADLSKRLDILPPPPLRAPPPSHPLPLPSDPTHSSQYLDLVKELAEAQKSESKARDELAREQEERGELEQKVRESEKARMEAVQLAEAAQGSVATTAGEARTAVDGGLEGLRKELSSKASELYKAYLRNEKLQRTIDDLRAKNDDLRDQLAVDQLISPPHDLSHLADQRPPTFSSSLAASASDSNSTISSALSSSLSNSSAVLPHTSSAFAAPAPSLPSSTGADVSHSQLQAEHRQTQLILVQTQAKLADADRTSDKLNERLRKLYAKVQNLHQEKLQLKSDQTQATSRVAELEEELRFLRQTLETINTSSGRTDEEMQEEVERATAASEERVLTLEAQQEELKGRVREMQELVEGFQRKSLQAEETRRKEEEKARVMRGRYGEVCRSYHTNFNSMLKHGEARIELLQAKADLEKVHDLSTYIEKTVQLADRSLDPVPVDISRCLIRVRSLTTEVLEVCSPHIPPDVIPPAS